MTQLIEQTIIELESYAEDCEAIIRKYSQDNQQGQHNYELQALAWKTKLRNS